MKKIGPSIMFLLILVLASVWHSGYANEGAVKGSDLYVKHCQACHGTDGKGNGTFASRLNPPPPDLTAPKFWNRNGVEKKIAESITNGSGIMPPFKQLKPNEVDEIVKYLSDTFRPK